MSNTAYFQIWVTSMIDRDLLFSEALSICGVGKLPSVHPHSQVQSESHGKTVKWNLQILTIKSFPGSCGYVPVNVGPSIPDWCQVIFTIYQHRAPSDK